jgi:hypothetical protein
MSKIRISAALVAGLSGAPALAQEGGSYVPGGGALTANSTATSGFSAGQLFYSDGAKLQALGQGSSGQFLQSNGAGATPGWGSPTGSGTVSSCSQYSVGVYLATGTTINCSANLTLNGATLAV